MTDYKPLHCRQCHRLLALATPTRILFNVGVYCDEPVALRCATCGVRRFWHPIKPALDECAILVEERMLLMEDQT